MEFGVNMRVYSMGFGVNMRVYSMEFREQPWLNG